MSIAEVVSFEEAVYEDGCETLTDLHAAYRRCYDVCIEAGMTDEETQEYLDADYSRALEELR